MNETVAKDSSNQQTNDNNVKTNKRRKEMETEVTFWGNGQVQSITNYRNGIIDGLYTEYYEDGRKSLEITVRNGLQHGLVTKWYSNHKTLVEVYDYGELISSHGFTNTQRNIAS